MKTFKYLFLAIIVTSMWVSAQAQESLSPYLKTGTTTESMPTAVASAKTALETANFQILGDYQPENNPMLHVIAYTRKDLQTICLKKEDRGALASVLKVGFVEKNGVVTISMLNPMYLFYAYLGDDIKGHESQLSTISIEAIATLATVGSAPTPFGGSVEIDDLKDYHFMAFMPRFDDPEEIHEFDSFDEGMSTILTNLKAGKGQTTEVYQLIFPEEKIALFGVGLLNTDKGEAHFLPIIGEDNIAAMPYEIILQDNEATILPGKYRLALHWPELTMGEFMKIMSTPGDVESTLEGLTEK